VTALMSISLLVNLRLRIKFFAPRGDHLGSIIAPESDGVCGQSEAPNVRTGIPAEVVDASNSSRKGMGKVARVSGDSTPRPELSLPKSICL
jgi:hypothetical protein